MVQRVLLVALAWCAVRGEEYVGGAMPQYGGDYESGHGAPGNGGSGADLALAEDYHGHSHDAPAPLDYKYEEELQGENVKPQKYIDEASLWRKSARKQKRPAPVRDDIRALEMQHIDADSEVILKTNRRGTRRKARGRRDKPRREALVPTHRRSRHDDDDEVHYLEKIDYRHDSSRYREDDDFTQRKDTTARVIRRKPRDRVYVPAPMTRATNTAETGDDELNEDRRVKEHETDYWSSDEGNKGVARERPLIPGLDTESESSTIHRGRSKQRTYQDYGDYYDRMNNLQTKFPVLQRRTTTMLLRNRLSAHTTMSDLMRAVWPGRRAGDGASPPDFSVASPATTSASTSTAASAATTSTTTTNAASNTVENVTELSLAEKSRLSILKKAQMKEMVKSSETKKPPVLLRVTSRLPTVVMVEPATSADPWKHARLVEGDSPETLDKVKRLMRQKLVAGAKSIRDLTDNWDDTVCDYIDVSMLEAAAPHLSEPLLALTCYFCLLLVI